MSVYYFTDNKIFVYYIVLQIKKYQLREILTISIDDKLKKKIDNASKKYKLSKSKFVKLAVEKFIAHEDLRNLRNKLLTYAEKAGYLTDEDIF